MCISTFDGKFLQVKRLTEKQQKQLDKAEKIKATEQEIALKKEQEQEKKDKEKDDKEKDKDKPPSLPSTPSSPSRGSIIMGAGKKLDVSCGPWSVLATWYDSLLALIVDC